MGRTETADHLPLTVLARPDFLEACATRDLGEVLAISVKWGGPGFTQSHIARQCELTPSRVGEYIKGVRQAQSVDVWARVSDGLRIPGQLLQLGNRPWEEDVTDVKRRDFMNLGSKIAAVGAVSAAIPAAAPRIPSTNSKVAELQREIDRLRYLDETVGGSDLYIVYRPLLQKLSFTLKNTNLSEVGKRDLRRLYAEHAQQTGWAAFDAGDHEEARNLYEGSFQAAIDGKDHELAANALAFRAYQLDALGEDATDVTARSISFIERGARPGVKALLYQRGAWSYARANRADETSRLLGLAEESIAADDGDSPGWASWAASEVEQEIMSGRCWTQLRRPLRSVPALERAMTKYGDHHSRDKALYLTWLADAYVDAGEPERAAAATSQAIDLAELVASVRPQERIGSVLGRLEEFRGSQEVANVLAHGSAHPFQVRV